MASLFDFLSMAVDQNRGGQKLPRRPEPDSVTPTAEAASQYNQVILTKLAILYAVGLEIIHRACLKRNSALDLACGPGHYTLCLAKYLGYQQVTGVDLSPPAIERATQNAKAQGLEPRVRFEVGDIIHLDRVGEGAVDLTSLTEGAHHMPDLPTVAQIFREMDRITKPEGLIMVMDLHRLRTLKLTERYVDTLGRDYRERGLSSFFNDFHNSMYAAWTAQELRSALPSESRRWWCHWVPWGLPTTQIILGLPIGRKRVFIRSGFSAKENPFLREWFPRWEKEVSPGWARETLREWRLARASLFASPKRLIRLGQTAPFRSC